jgi:hypothetical protein
MTGRAVQSVCFLDRLRNKFLACNDSPSARYKVKIGNQTMALQSRNLIDKGWPQQGAGGFQGMPQGMPNIPGLDPAQMAQAMQMMNQMMLALQRICPPGLQPQHLLYGVLGVFVFLVYYFGILRALLVVGLVVGTVATSTGPSTPPTRGGGIPSALL